MRPEELKGSMRLWGFTPTHERLVVEVFSNHQRCFLHFSMCTRVSAPTGWDAVHPTVTKDGTLLRYCDEGVEIVCEEIGIFPAA